MLYVLCFVRLANIKTVNCWKLYDWSQKVSWEKIVVLIVCSPNDNRKMPKKPWHFSMTPEGLEPLTRRLRDNRVNVYRVYSVLLSLPSSSFGFRNVYSVYCFHALVPNLHQNCRRPFGCLINASPDATCDQEQVFSPWRFREPSNSGLVSFQGT